MENLYTLRIRKLRPSDANSISKIMRMCLPHLYRRSTNFSYTYHIFEKWLGRVMRCIKWRSLHFIFTDVYDKVIFVAELSNKVVGFVEGFPLTDNEWLVNAVAVLPNYRTRGIGQKLVKKLISHLQQRGWKKILLYVKPDNIPAIRLYKKLGFKEVKYTKICMLLDINASSQFTWSLKLNHDN